MNNNSNNCRGSLRARQSHQSHSPVLVLISPYIRYHLRRRFSPPSSPINSPSLSTRSPSLIFSNASTVLLILLPQRQPRLPFPPWYVLLSLNYSLIPSLSLGTVINNFVNNIDFDGYLSIYPFHLLQVHPLTTITLISPIFPKNKKRNSHWIHSHKPANVNKIVCRVIDNRNGNHCSVNISSCDRS